MTKLSILMVLFVYSFNVLAVAPPCLSPPSNIGGSWVCYPEVPPGDDVPENTHCIFTCGESSTLHTCSQGYWDNDPANLRCIEGCSPIYGLDPTSEFTCIPPIVGNATAPEGTYCIFSCNGHQVDELLCEDGHWSDDPGHLSCSTSPATRSTSSATEHPSTMTTPFQSTSITEFPAPPIEINNTWGFYYLGTGIGASGIIVFDNRTEFVVGSGSGFGRNTKISLLEKSTKSEGYIVRKEFKFEVAITKIERVYSLDLIAVGTEDGRIYLVFPDLSGLYDIIDGGVQGQEIIDIIYFDPTQHSRLEMVVLSKNTLSIFENTTQIAQIKFETSGNIAFGHFTNYPAVHLVDSNGDVYEFAYDFQTIELIGSFGEPLGRFIRTMDIDGDHIDEIIGSHGGIKAYSALDFSRIWNHEVDITVDALSIHDINNDGILDVLYGDDQWGSIYGLDSKTGEEFWKVRNPEHGVTCITAGDFDGDGSSEVAWGAGYSSTGGDYFFIVDVESKNMEWSSTDLDGPFLGYDIKLNPSNLKYEILLTSSESDSNYDGGITYALDFASNVEIWKKENGDSWSGVNALLAGDVDEDGFLEVITLGSSTYDGRVHVMNADNGELKYTANLDDVLHSGLLVDMDNNKQLEIIVGDDAGTITILNGNDGSEYVSYSQIGSGTIKQLATTKNNQIVDKIFALSRDGLWKINIENNHVSKVGNSSFNPTSVATIFNQWIFVGDDNGQLHQLDGDLNVSNSYQICQGPITHLQSYSAWGLSFTCEECFGLFNTYDEEILVRQNVDNPVWRAQAYNIENRLYFLTGGDVVQLWSEVN